MPEILESARPILIAFGLKVLGAIVAFVVGRQLIGLAARLLTRALERKKVEATVIGYLRTVVTVALNVILVVALLGYFGTFILVLRPFKVGDYVMAGDVEGDVRAIGLFSTTIDTPDNVQTLVGNAKIMGGTIKNFSSNPYRRVELLAQIDHSVDPLDAIRRLKAALPTIPNVIAEPKPDVEILTFNERGPVLAVRPYCNNAHYWQVYFDTNASIRATFGAAGYPAAEAHVHMRQRAA